MTAIDLPNRPSKGIMRRLKAHFSAHKAAAQMRIELGSMCAREMLDLGIHAGDIPVIIRRTFDQEYKRYLHAE